MNTTILNQSKTINNRLINIQPFKLERNHFQSGRRHLLLSLGVFILPTLFVYVVFNTMMDLEGIELIISTGLTALFLLNLTVFILNKITKKNRTLLIGFNEIKVLENSKLIQVIPFEQLEITDLNRNRNDKCSIIRISAKEFPYMTIGSRISVKDWKNISSTVDTTIFLISKESEWKRLLNILSNYIK